MATAAQVDENLAEADLLQLLDTSSEGPSRQKKAVPADQVPLPVIPSEDSASDVDSAAAAPLIALVVGYWGFVHKEDRKGRSSGIESLSGM